MVVQCPNNWIYFPFFAFFGLKLNVRILYCEIRPTLLLTITILFAAAFSPTGCCAKKNLLLRCRLNRNGSNAQLFVFWDQESGNLMLKAIGFWFCCSSSRWSWPPLNPFFAMLKKEWPSDRERLEWHKRLISNPFGSKMVPHCITTSAFTADNFGHRVQSIYLRIRQLKSTKHHTKNTQPKTFWFCTFYLHSETHQNDQSLKIIDSYSFIRKCNNSQSILKESLSEKFGHKG